MKKTLKIALTVLAAIGTKSYATVYAAAKLTKNGETVYLLSDVLDESPIAVEQRQAILERSQQAMTLLVVPDPSDIRGLLLSLPESNFKVAMSKLQTETEKRVDSLRSLSPSIVTLAHRLDIRVANINYESMLVRKDISVETIKDIIDEVLTFVDDETSGLSEADLTEFRRCVTAVSQMTQANRNYVELQNGLRDLTAYLERLCALRFARNINEGVSALICSKPDDIAFVASYLLKEGWEGDASQVICFGRSWRKKLDAEKAAHAKWLEQKTGALANLQILMKKSKNQATKKRLQSNFTKQWEGRIFNPVERGKAIACEMSNGPIDLKRFFEGIQSDVLSVSQASSSSNCVQSSSSNQAGTSDVQAQGFDFARLQMADACGRLNHVLSSVRETPFAYMQHDEKVQLAHQIYRDLLPILYLNDERVPQGSAYQLCLMQIHASELMGYYYLQAQEYIKACTSFYNVLAAAYNYFGGWEAVPGTPLHSAVCTLAQLIKTEEYKQHFVGLIKDNGCDDEEIGRILADLESRQ